MPYAFLFFLTFVFIFIRIHTYIYIYIILRLIPSNDSITRALSRLTAPIYLETFTILCDTIYYYRVTLYFLLDETTRDAFFTFFFFSFFL